MRISYDPHKREQTLKERGLDFNDASTVFQGITVEVEDRRKDYGEGRIICYGLLAGRCVVIGCTPRGSVRHIFSMRKAERRVGEIQRREVKAIPGNEVFAEVRRRLK